MVMLATAAELATHLKHPVKTAAAEQAISVSSAYVEGVTGLAFTARTATISLAGVHSYTLEIPLKPIRGVTAVTAAGVPVTDHVVTAAGLFHPWGWGGPLVSVEMVVQYGATVTPDDIKGVVLEMAGSVYDERQGISSEGVDDYRVTYTENLSPMSRSVLASYGAGARSVGMINR